MFQRLLLTITWHLCKESVFAVLALLFQDLCNSTGHALNHLLGQILTDSNPFCHNHFLEFVRISGFLFVHPPLEDWLQIINGIKIPGHGPKISTFWSPSHLVIICLMARCSIVLENNSNNSSPNCCWKKLLLEAVLVPFFIHGCVYGQNCEWAHSLGWEATPHMNGLRMLCCWPDTGLMVALTFSSPDKTFSRCPNRKQASSENMTLPQSSGVHSPYFL